jgi:hypothetical protein
MDSKTVWFFIFAAIVHVTMLSSLMSEPFRWEPGVNMIGSKSHPSEISTESGFLDPLFHDTDRVPRGLDFFSIYQAGYNFLNGCSVYYGVREHKFGNHLLVVPYFSGFRYLPAYAYIFGSALNIFSPWISYWGWIGCVEILLLLNIMALRWYPCDMRKRLFLAGLWLAYTPYYIELHIGQQSMVTVTLLHFAGVLHLQRRNQSRDICYGLSVLWKLNTILLAPLWFKFRRYGSLLLLGVVICLLSAPYFLMVPGSFQEFSSYFHLNFISIGPSSLGLWALIGTIWQRCLPDSLHMQTALNIISFLFLFTAAAATILPRRIPFIHGLALWICIYFLTYQYVWEHHYVMLLPAFSLLVGTDSSKIWPVLWVFCAIPTPYYFLNIPAEAMPQLLWSAHTDILYHSCKIIPVVIMFFVLVVRMIRGNAFEPSEEQQFVLQKIRG